MVLAVLYRSAQHDREKIMLPYHVRSTVLQSSTQFASCIYVDIDTLDFTNRK